MAELKNPPTTHAAAARLERGANFFYAANDYAQALTLQLQAAQLWEQLDARANVADCLQGAGVLYLLLQQHASALDTFARAMAIRIELQDVRGQAINLARLGEVYQSMDQHADAIDNLGRALALAVSVANAWDIASLFNNMAISYEALGHLDWAAQHYAQALKLHRSTGDQTGLCSVLHNFGVCQLKRGQHTRARQLLQNAHAISEAIDNQRSMGQISLSLGQLCEEQDDIVQAHSHYRHALKAARHSDVNSIEDEAKALDNYGGLAIAAGDTRLAQRLLERAIKVLPASGRQGLLTKILYNYAVAYANTGEYQQALTHLRHAQEIQEQTGDVPGLQETEQAINIVLAKLSHRPQAGNTYYQ